MGKNESKTHTDLSVVEGTVAYTIISHQAEIDYLCMSEHDFNTAKAKIIKIIEDNSKNCKSRNSIIFKIKHHTNNIKLHLYLYDLILAASNLNVI